MGLDGASLFVGEMVLSVVAMDRAGSLASPSASSLVQPSSESLLRNAPMRGFFNYIYVCESVTSDE